MDGEPGPVRINRAHFGFLDLVWIRLFRPVRAIAEPWDEGDGIEWAKNGCRPGDLAVAFWDANPGVLV